ncbi:MAG: bifunctional diaminohydroxyphosphoribosylaminopyrimidine deaminase/5-amino-6-(5-phosphoribosylamino)uracil reductase RibD [Lachnospiraceae bacterium]|nr:bifunctional diaminohydroxyphosphoribosylaminopyrimidine deaminase/5-amino-6-(5-phosphoribosylamino)uracil reductase RibD [Lachnospiraceae bacterium]
MTDQEYMRRAIELARGGIGRVNPNPLVGAVIVKEGRIIGEGFHRQYGALHAERDAISNLTESAEGATIYVTLEPCCHYGKQPPCTEAILEQKIARVVIGSRDPNPLVAGKGAAILRSAGVQVEEDFLREECDELNPVFFHYITTGTPYVVMKYAMTADGKIATRTGASKWITGEAARHRVQELRNACTGIMAGIGTVLADDPMLNVRIPDRRSPVRIICDSQLRIPMDSQLVQTAEQYPVIIACAWQEEQQELQEKARELEKRGITVWNLPDEKGQVDLAELMVKLGREKIDSVLLEGGGILNDSALRAGIVSEVQAFVAPKLFGGAQAKSPVEGEGVADPSEAVMMELKKMEQIGEDLLLTYRIRR